MPKAVIAMKSGSTVTVEGSQEEVAALVSRLEGGHQPLAPPAKRPSGARRETKPTLTGLIAELIAEGFFSKPKELNAVRVALEERGHFYPVTTLSPIMLRFVKKRELRRIKEKKRWAYVG